MLLEQDGPGTRIRWWCFVQNFMHSFGPSSPRFVDGIISGPAGNVNALKQPTFRICVTRHLILVMQSCPYAAMMGFNSGVGKMQKGDIVEVDLTSGERVKMVVWTRRGASVLVCTPGGYEAALKSGRKPRMVEYREWALQPA